MNDVRFLHDQLRKGYSDDPWHGPATASLLQDLSAAEAAARPVNGAHSIWEIVLHMTAWQSEVRWRLRGKEPSLPEEGDWPAVPEAKEAAWQHDRDRLGASLTELLHTVAALGEPDLEGTGGAVPDRDPALGTGVTLRATVSGIIQHNAYHSGQIALLRKALRPG